MAVYRWVIDQIMLEEAKSGQIIASNYVAPFSDQDSNKCILPEGLSFEFVKEFVQLMAYCIGASFVPPKIGFASNLSISGELNEHSKKLIKEMRNRYISMYDNANRTMTKNITGDVIPVNLDFRRE